MPEKADPVSALREALEIIANAQSMSEWDAQSAIAVKVQYIAHLALKRYRAALSGEAPAGLDGEVERKLDDLWAEAQRSQAVGQDGPMRYGNGIEYAVRAIRRVLADHPIPDVTFDAALSGEAPDRDGEVERIAAAIGPTVGRWFEAGYESGRLDHVTLAEQIAPLIAAPSLEGARHPEAGERRDHDTCVPHDHAEPDNERWERDQAAALAASPGARHDVPGLDEAWAETEAALPDGWCDLMVWHYDPEPGDHHEPGHYGAKTADPQRTEPTGAPFEVFGYGPTPAAALRNLAARLSAPPVLVPRDEPTREDIEG